MIALLFAQAVATPPAPPSTLSATPAAPPVSVLPVLPASVQPTMLAQLDYATHAPEPATYDGFKLARLRLGVRAPLAPWLVAVGSFEYASEKVTPFETYVEATVARSLHFSVGFRRTPLFHTAKDELIESLPVPELSLPVRALWPGLDLGAEAHYTPETIPLEAWLRVGNGSASIEGNDGPHPAFDGRADLVLGRARAHGGSDDGFWGLRVGAGGHAKDRVDTSGLSDTTPDGFLFFHPVPTNGWQVIGEGHVAAWIERLALTLEAGTAHEQRSATASASIPGPAGAITTRGAAFEAAYMLWGPARRPGRSGAPGIWPNESAASLDSWHGGSIELAARVERVDLEADARDVKPGGAEGGSASLNWWATPYTSLALAAYDYHLFLAPIEEPSETQFWLVLARATVSLR